MPSDYIRSFNFLFFNSMSASLKWGYVSGRLKKIQKITSASIHIHHVSIHPHTMYNFSYPVCQRNKNWVHPSLNITKKYIYQIKNLWNNLLISFQVVTCVGVVCCQYISCWITTNRWLYRGPLLSVYILLDHYKSMTLSIFNMHNSYSFYFKIA